MISGNPVMKKGPNPEDGSRIRKRPTLRISKLSCPCRIVKPERRIGESCSRKTLSSNHSRTRRNPAVHLKIPRQGSEAAINLRRNP